MAEAFVAKWFPKKHQLVLATFAGYAGLYGLFKMVKGNPKAPKPVAPSKQVASLGPTAAAEGGYQGPTMDNFDQWASNPENLKQWEQWASKPGNIENWEKSLS